MTFRDSNNGGTCSVHVPREWVFNPGVIQTCNSSVRVLSNLCLEARGFSTGYGPTRHQSVSATEELQMTDERQPTARRGMSAVPPSQSSANEEQLPPPPRLSSGGEIQGTIARPVMVPASEPALNSPFSEEMNFETWSSRVFALLGTAGLQGAVSRIAPPRGARRGSVH